MMPVLRFPRYSLLFTLFALLMLPACESMKNHAPSWMSGDEKKEEEKKDLSAEELFTGAKNKLLDRRYQAATKDFEEIERLYPFSPLATRGKIMTAYADYRDEKYENAIDVIDDFTRLHPGNQDIAYMYYLKAICYYDRIADVKRDQAVTEDALDTLEEVVRRFPDTEYARDAKLKIDLVNDHLAGKQMEIGRFYLKQKKYIAAINRFRQVIDKYQTTTHTPEALYRMVESYISLGLKDEAQKNAAVLGHNFPASKWYDYAYRLVEHGKDAPQPEEEKSWINRWTGGAEEKTSQPLPHDDNAKSWLPKL